MQRSSTSVRCQSVVLRNNPGGVPAEVQVCSNARTETESLVPTGMGKGSGNQPGFSTPSFLFCGGQGMWVDNCNGYKLLGSRVYLLRATGFVYFAVGGRPSPG